MKEEKDYTLKLTEDNLKSFIGNLTDSTKAYEVMVFGEGDYYLHKAELEAMENWIKEAEEKLRRQRK